MYLDDYVSNEVIREDILDILEARSDSAYADWNKTEELTSMLESKYVSGVGLCSHCVSTVWSPSVVYR